MIKILKQKSFYLSIIIFLTTIFIYRVLVNLLDHTFYESLQNTIIDLPRMLVVSTIASFIYEIFRRRK